MPTAVKRLKAGANRKVATSTHTLDAFTTLSKVGAIPKSKVIERTPSIAISGVSLEPSTSKKRKLEDDNAAAEPLPSVPLLLSQQPIAPQTPNKQYVSRSSIIPVDRSTKGVQGPLDEIFVAKTPKHSPLNSKSSVPQLSTRKSKISHIESIHNYPVELLELINLHAAFLTTLSIQYAHNGTSSPIDLRNVLPNVAHTWGKRKVLVEDIRRTLGVLNADQKGTRLSLVDYGNGKVCIDLTPGAPSSIRPLNEETLNMVFLRELTKRWDQRVDATMGVKDFIATLPMEHIKANLLKSISPLLAKGQRRLEEFQRGIMIKKTEAKEIPSTPDGTKMTLLERLRAKQIQQSKLSPLPTKTELTRMAALGKLEEIASVLGVLSTSSSIGQQRISFTMSTILEKLKDSCNSPISKTEGDTCIRLLATEVAPNWLKIIRMGKNEMIVIDREQRLAERDIRERIKVASIIDVA